MSSIAFDEHVALLGQGKSLLLVGKRLSSDAVTHRTRAVEAEESALTSERAAALLRLLSDERAEDLAKKVSDLVTEGLRSVFADDSVEFKVSSRTLRGQSSIEFSLVTDGVERPIMDYHGGGVAEVIAFVLRVVVVLLSPGTRRILILDEPFARVSVNYRPRLAAFVRDLAKSTGLQLLVVTHDDSLPEVADVCYRVSREAGSPTVFERVETDEF